MQGAGGGPNRPLPVSYRLAACLVSDLLGVAVDERRHCVAGNGSHRAVGSVRPAGADALRSQPRDFTVELVIGGNIAEVAGCGQVHVRGTRCTVEERSHGVTVHRCGGAERAVRVAGGDALSLHPLNLLVEGVRGGHVLEARSGGGSELRGTLHAVEERRHCATFHGLQRAVGAVRVAGGDATLSQPRNFGVELVAALHIGEAGRSNVLGLLLLDAQHLGAVALGAVGAGEVAGTVVQVQQQRLGGCAGFTERGDRVSGAVRRQGGGGASGWRPATAEESPLNHSLGLKGRYLIQPVSLTLPHSYWVVALTRY